MPRKLRIDIPAATAAEVLFRSDRTCCVCRQRGKPVQIHHIDDDPGNNDVENLSVVCFDCHRDTQLRGGFDRKLDAGQVILYRDDWNRVVADARAMSGAVAADDAEVGAEVELATSIAEIYRENEAWYDLAAHHAACGNSELCDKYAEKALEAGVEPWMELLIRVRLQKRPDLLPDGLVDRVLSETHDWTARAQMLAELGRTRESVKEYCLGIVRTLDNGSVFTAAYYLKELAAGSLVQDLFSLALSEASAKNDLWWQIRALDELDWLSERRALVLSHADEIRGSNNVLLLRELALAEKDERAYVEIRKQMARDDSWLYTIHVSDETEANQVAEE